MSESRFAALNRKEGHANISREALFTGAAFAAKTAAVFVALREDGRQKADGFVATALLFTVRLLCMRLVYGAEVVGEGSGRDAGETLT